MNVCVISVIEPVTELAGDPVLTVQA